MKIAGVLLQLALAVVLAASSTATLSLASDSSVNSGSMSSEADFPAPSLSGSFDGSQREAPIDCRRNRIWDGSGSRFPGMGSKDGSYDFDTGSQMDDGSHGSDFPCGPRFPGSGSSGDSSRCHRRQHHFRGDVGDDYDFSSGDDTFDPFDDSGSGSSSGVPHHRHHHHHCGRKSGSGSGSYAFDGSVDDDDWSGSFDPSDSRDVFPPRLPHGSQLGSGSGYSHRLRGSGPDLMS